MDSLWKQYLEPQNHVDALPSPSNLEFDVVIVGAGIAGILTGYFLSQNGLRIALLEAQTACSGITLGTTAKITLAPRLFYHKLLTDLGFEQAKHYAAACQSALSAYDNLITSQSIDCDYEVLPMYIFSNGSERILIEEQNAAIQLNLEPTLENNIELPFSITNAIRYERQAQFNPIKFLNALKQNLPIYEHTLVTDIKRHFIYTSSGVLSAKNIVVTSHFPIIKYPGLSFMKMHQSRSYVLALDNVPKLSAMYADADLNGYAFRSYKNYLLLSGNSHRTGENPNGGHYAGIRAAAKIYYPEAIEKYHWSTQDCISIDNIPYIGKYSRNTRNLYIATGFNKWGMHHAMISALILSDQILHQERAFSRTTGYAGFFSPQRYYFLRSMPSFLNECKHSIENRITRKRQNSNAELRDLLPGKSILVDSTNGKLGAYKDWEGKLHLVSAVCPHMHCILVFNPEELTWDCPCHGSRIDIDGNVIKNPAIKETPLPKSFIS